jgi:hypothetical protein
MDDTEWNGSKAKAIAMKKVPLVKIGKGEYTIEDMAELWNLVPEDIRLEATKKVIPYLA